MRDGGGGHVGEKPSSRTRVSGKGKRCEREAVLLFDVCVFEPASVCDNPEIEERFSAALASPLRLSHVRTTNCSWKEKLNSLKVLLVFSLIQVPPVFFFM